MKSFRKTHRKFKKNSRKTRRTTHRKRGGIFGFGKKTAAAAEEARIAKMQEEYARQSEIRNAKRNADAAEAQRIKDEAAQAEFYNSQDNDDDDTEMTKFYRSMGESEGGRRRRHKKRGTKSRKSRKY
jgi:hypothetical protein